MVRKASDTLKDALGNAEKQIDGMFASGRSASDEVPVETDTPSFNLTAE
jgi:hypothetical protein